MAFFDSKVSKFLIDDTGSTQRDLSPYITEVRGLPGPRTLNEVTALGDSGVKFHPGAGRRDHHPERHVRQHGHLRPRTRCWGPYAPTPRRWTSSTGPRAPARGDVKYSGTCWVVSYELRSRVGNLVEWSASLQVEGNRHQGYVLMRYQSSVSAPLPRMKPRTNS